MSSKKQLTGPVFTMLFSLVVLLLIPFIRYLKGNMFSPTIETYVHLNALHTTSLSFYDFVLKKIIALSSLQIAVILLPLLFGFGSLLFAFLLLKPLLKKKGELCATILVLVLTPSFIALHTGFTLYAPLLFFTLVSFYLFRQHSFFYLLFLSLLFFLDPFYATLFFGLSLIAELSKKRYINSLFIVLTYALLIASFTLQAYLPFTFSFLFHFSPSINGLFSFLGGKYGYSLFLVLLGLGGFFLKSSRTKSAPYKMLQALFLLFSIFYEPARLLGFLLLSYYAVQAFIALISYQWHTQSLQKLTALLLLCILLFSTTTFIKEEIKNPPTNEQIASLYYLQRIVTQNFNQTTPHIITLPAHAPFVTFFSGLPAYTHNTNEIFSSQNFPFIASIFIQQKIAFVYVDQSMLQGGVWQRPDEGLLFVMKYSDRFRKIYDANGNTLYYFLDWNATVSQESALINHP